MGDKKWTVASDAIGPNRVPVRRLANGAEMPVVGMGTFGSDKYDGATVAAARSEEHTSELQSRRDIVCRLLLEKKCFLVCIFYFPCVLIQYRMGVVELLAVPDGDAVVVIQPGFPTGHAARFFKSYRIACDAYSLLDNHITNWLEVSAAREQR